MCAAAFSDNSRSVKILLKNGANVNAVANDGVTALGIAIAIAVQRRHKSITGALIRAGSNLDAEHSSGDRPLHLAARMGHVEAITVLVAGANVDSRGARGETALWIVAARGYPCAVEVLLGAGANPLLATCINEEQMPPLDIAAWMGSIDVVHKLLRLCGIEICGGESGGALAPKQAAALDHPEILLNWAYPVAELLKCSSPTAPIQLRPSRSSVPPASTSPFLERCTLQIVPRNKLSRHRPFDACCYGRRLSGQCLGRGLACHRKQLFARYPVCLPVTRPRPPRR